MPDNKRLTVNPYENLFEPTGAPTEEQKLDSRQPAQKPPRAEPREGEHREPGRRHRSSKQVSQVDKLINLRKSQPATWQDFDHVNTRLRRDQISFLDDLARTMNRQRSRGVDKERITKNTLIRAAIEALAELQIDVTEIRTEEELTKRVRAAAAQRGKKS